MVRLTFILFFSCLTLMASGQKAVYEFCVSSPSFKTFKARVIFNSVDFGEMAARQMVYNDVYQALGQEVLINKYNAACQCFDKCPLLEVASKDWDGNLSENKLSTSNMVGSMAEMVDKLVSESKAAFNDPGGFIKRNIFGLK